MFFLTLQCGPPSPIPPLPCFPPPTLNQPLSPFLYTISLPPLHPALLPSSIYTTPLPPPSPFSLPTPHLPPPHTTPTTPTPLPSSPFPLPLNLHPSSQTKVSQLHLQIIIQKQVAQFKVTMNYLEQQKGDYT